MIVAKTLDEFLDKSAIDVSTQAFSGTVTVEKQKLQSYPSILYTVLWAYVGKDKITFYDPQPMAYDSAREDDSEEMMDALVRNAALKLRSRGLDVREQKRALALRREKFYASTAAEMLNTSGAVTSEFEMRGRHAENIGTGPACDVGTIYAMGARKNLTNEQVLSRIKQFYALHPVA